MKVLFTFGGLPHYYNKVLNKLQQEPDLDIVVLAPEQNQQTLGAGVKQAEDGLLFRVIRLPEYNTWYGKAFFRNLSELIDIEKPDIVVTVWPYVLGFIYFPLLWLKLKRKGIRLIFKDIPFMLPARKEANAYYKNPDVLRVNEDYVIPELGVLYGLKIQFLTFSRRLYYGLLADAHVHYIEGAAPLVATYGAKPESVFVTYNSPDTDELFEARAYIADLPTILPPNPHRILHVGRLVKWKRVDLLIDALARILPSIPDAELVVIGTGPEMTTLQDQAKRLDIERHVKFVGGVYKLTDLGRYLNESALYVLAGMGGLSINEAMAFGKPVVCSVCDGTEKHLVREGINGRYFTHGDVVSLAEVINDIITDPLTLTQMGEASTAIIRDEIHIGTVIDGYKKAFQYVIKLG
ncbi:MAG: hypothetical protein RIS47_621 [Bacteroidota bacterium]